MSFTVVEHALYQKALKKLLKKYRNAQTDIHSFLKNISSIEELGVELKPNVYKARIANSNKNRGKSAGYRLITYLEVVEDELHLIYVYDKSILTNITEKELDDLLVQQLTDQ